jgi:hypothetical protein
VEDEPDLADTAEATFDYLTLCRSDEGDHIEQAGTYKRQAADLKSEGIGRSLGKVHSCRPLPLYTPTVPQPSETETKHKKKVNALSVSGTVRRELENYEGALYETRRVSS